jgi:hypothetical protein
VNRLREASALPWLVKDGERVWHLSQGCRTNSSPTGRRPRRRWRSSTLSAPVRSTWTQATGSRAPMLGRSKTAIDSACELIGFWRFNAFGRQVLAEQPRSSPALWAEWITAN